MTIVTAQLPWPRATDDTHGCDFFAHRTPSRYLLCLPLALGAGWDAPSVATAVSFAGPDAYGLATAGINSVKCLIQGVTGKVVTLVYVESLHLAFRCLFLSHSRITLESGTSWIWPQGLGDTLSNSSLLHL